MKIFRICRDRSDQFYQDFTEFGFFLKRETAIEQLVVVIRNEEGLVKDDELQKSKETGIYRTSLGEYYLEEIEVTE
jgi:hypothetical protein